MFVRPSQVARSFVDFISLVALQIVSHILFRRSDLQELPSAILGFQADSICTVTTHRVGEAVGVRLLWGIVTFPSWRFLGGYSGLVREICRCNVSVSPSWTGGFHHFISQWHVLQWPLSCMRYGPSASTSQPDISFRDID